MKQIMLLTALAGGLLAATAVLAADAADTNTTAAAASGTNDAAATAADQTPPADATPQPADTTPQPAATPEQATATPAPAATVATTAPTPPAKPFRALAPGEKGLVMNFRDVPLDQVLDYMSKVAGFTMHTRVDSLSGTVTVWNDQPMSKEDAVQLLKQVLAEHGYGVLQDGKVLTVMTSLELRKKGIDVDSGTSPDAIPNNADMRTQIIPIASLNVVQLVKELQPLAGDDTQLTADESANSVMITGTSSNVKHLMQVIKALDSVNSNASTVRVYPLKFADAKSLVTLVKDLFPSGDSTGNGGGRGAFPGFGRRGGGGGGGGGGNPFAAFMGGDTGAESNGHTPTAKVNATSDDHSNSLIVSAPDSLIATIDELIKSLDVSVEETTEVRVFHLKNADAGETADLLTSLFPDSSNTTDASRSTPQFRFGGFGGGFGGGAGGGRGGAAAANAESDRMKKMAEVVAVADKRTRSLVVTAGKDVMPSIVELIDDLDSRNDRKMSPHYIALGNADPAVVQQLLQEQFMPPSNAPKTSSATLTTGLSPLNDRTKTLQQQFNQTTGSSTSSGGSRTGTSF